MYLSKSIQPLLFNIIIKKKIQGLKIFDINYVKRQKNGFTLINTLFTCPDSCALMLIAQHHPF